MPHKIPGDEPHPIDLHVGRTIAEQRRRQGLSQTQVANAVGVTFQQMQKYEKGSNRVSASRLHQIAEVLALPVSAFFPSEGAGDAEPHHFGRTGSKILQLLPRLSPGDQKTVLALVSSLAARGA